MTDPNQPPPPPPGYGYPASPPPPGPPGPPPGQQPVSGCSGHPVQLSIERAPTQSRVLALFGVPFLLIRIVMAIPTVTALYFVGLAAFAVVCFGFWAMPCPGHYPEAMHRLVTGYVRWNTRLTAFLYALPDKYPPFSLQP